MNILILSPRLDTTFKYFGPVSPIKGPTPDNRRPWEACINGIKREHLRRGDNVTVLEQPLWWFKPDNINEKHYDRIYVPHRESHSFPLPGDKARYYMQSVIPELFYIDTKGFAGGASFYPMTNLYGMDLFWYDWLCKRIEDKTTKFDQPNTVWHGPGEYVLFTCQIPHDQTILYHSRIKVEEALRLTCEATKNINKTLVVKGHPVNPGAMETLKQITKEFNHALWIDNVNIHDAIAQAETIVTVNSGTGLEALLHKKPVYTFGDCEYDCVTMKENLEQSLLYPTFDEDKVRRFFATWMDKMFNTNDIQGFKKL